MHSAQIVEFVLQPDNSGPGAPTWGNLVRDDSGQDLIEYALVAALLSISAVATMKGLGAKIVTLFQWIGTSITSAT